MRQVLHRMLRATHLHLERHHDPYLEIAELLDANGVHNVLDGGAEFGGHTQRFLQLWPRAVVHAFEPQLSTFARLEARHAANPRVRLYRVALSDAPGMAEFHVNDQWFTSSLLRSREPERMQPRAVEQVRTTTIDDWAGAESLPPPEVIKLDLQGHELAALRGGHRALSDGVRAIVAEVNFYPRYEGSCTFSEVARFLEQCRFRLWRLCEIINAVHGGWQQADAVFVHESLCA